MKINLYLSFIFLLFSACTSYTPLQTTDQPKSITDIPLRPHKQPVYLFFNGDRPDSQYYKVKLVEVTAPTGVRSDDMLQLLKDKARSEGLDGVILDEITKQAGSNIGVTRADEIYTFQKLAGIGIKFKHTINYMDEIIRAEKITHYSQPDLSPAVFEMNYDFYGNNLSRTDTAIRNFLNTHIDPFTGKELLYAPTPGWEYNIDEINNELIKRNSSDGYHPPTVSRFKYDGDKLVVATIKIPVADSYALNKLTLLPVYNEAGVLVKQRLNAKRVTLWLEDYEYNSNGTPSKIIRYRFNNGKPELLFERVFSYFSKDDLPTPFNN